VAIKTFLKRVLHVRRIVPRTSPVGACQSLSHDLQQWTRSHNSSSSSRCRRRRRRPRKSQTNNTTMPPLFREPKTVCGRDVHSPPCTTTRPTWYYIRWRFFNDAWHVTPDKRIYIYNIIYVSFTTLFVNRQPYTLCVLRTLSLQRPATGVPRQENFSASLARPSSFARHHRSQPREPPLHHPCRDSRGFW